MDDSEAFIPADVSDPASWLNLVEQTLEEFGDLHVLVNNAGTSYVNKVDFFHILFSHNGDNNLR